jgi:hypothetical protein
MALFVLKPMRAAHTARAQQEVDAPARGLAAAAGGR